MSKNKKKVNCESCGQRRNLERHYGKMVCSTCKVLRGACKHRRGVVLMNFLELGDLPKELEAEFNEVKMLQKEMYSLRARVLTA